MLRQGAEFSGSWVLHMGTFSPRLAICARARELPTDMKFRLAAAVSGVDLDRLPGLDDFKSRADRERGLDL